ncbi:hypothetical protein ACFL5H_01655 [Candidatus Latescibacterota bacterium]
MVMDVHAATFLLSGEGRKLLATLPKGGDPLETGRILRKRYSDIPPAFLSAAVELSMARERAAGKFTRASDMFFTREALEQATDERVAAHRAGRFAGFGEVLDLCCGIGGDAIALGRVAGHLAAIDRDPVRVLFCRENIRIYEVSATVTEGDIREMSGLIPGFDGVFIDPSRRRGGRRISRATAMEPPLEVALNIVARAKGGAVKLSPAIDPRGIGIDHEIEWISTGSGLKEAVVWTGRFIQARVSVTLIHKGVTLTDREVLPVRLTTADVGGYLFEPDPALIRSGLLDGKAASSGMWRIADRIAYMSSDVHIADPFFTCWRVLDSFPFGIRRLNERLRGMGAGPVTIKKRGFPLLPEEVLEKLRLTGDRPVTVILTRIGDRHRAFIVEPADNSLQGTAEPHL